MSDGRNSRGRRAETNPRTWRPGRRWQHPRRFDGRPRSRGKNLPGTSGRWHPPPLTPASGSSLSAVVSSSSGRVIGNSTGTEDTSFFLNRPFRTEDWRLYFNEDVTQSVSLLQLIAVFGEYLKARVPLFFQQQEFSKQESFVVDVHDLLADEVVARKIPNFREQLINEPEKIINAMGFAMHQIIMLRKEDETNRLSLAEEDEDVAANINKLKCDWIEPERMGQVCARLVNLVPRTLIRDLKASSYGKLVSIKGTVVSLSAIKPICMKMAFTCSACGQVEILPLREGKYALPTKCSSAGCCSRSFDPDYESMKTELVNWQTLKLLELSDDREQARVPQSIQCELYADLVCSCSPGDSVTLTGILKVNSTSEGSSRRQDDSCTFSLYVEVNAVQNCSRGLHGSGTKSTVAGVSKLGIEFTERDLDFIRELHAEPHLFRLLVHSLCPAIYGHEMVKAGLLLGLFGGARKFEDERNNVPVRGEPHVLVVGDPGLGKSQMLQACARVSPRGVYVCGNNATTSGLTVTLTKEGSASGGCENMEAGALVLADEGCCCIDEFDKLGQQQQQALLEAMEQQNVSICKAGVLCSLTARASILAAANPVAGHYDRGKTVAENLRLGAALLSRFDLVFILIDKPDEEADAMLSEHVIAQRSRVRAESGGRDSQRSDAALSTFAGDNTARALREGLRLKAGEAPLDVVPQQLLRTYIAYARTYVHPRLSQGAADMLQEFYVGLRKACYQGGGSSVTLRQLESLVRLSEARARLELREEVTVDDAADVLDIFKYSMMDATDDQLFSLRFQRSQRGSGTSRQSVAKRFVSQLNNLYERTSNALFTVQNLKQIAKESGLAIADFDSFLDTLNNHGYLLHKGRKLYQLNNV